MKRVRFTAAARREFLAQVAYYSEADPALGARFSAAVEAATLLALAYPAAGSPASRSTRRVFVKHFPFSVVYRPSGDGITVFALAHGSRLPGYWSSRVKEPVTRYAASAAAA